MMRKAKALVIVVVSICCLPSIAHADDFTGNKFLTLERMDRAMLVRGFIMGWHGSQVLTRVAIDVPPGVQARLQLCLPDEATLGQATDVATQYIQRNAADRHKDAGVLIWAAITDAWPCPK